MNETGVENGARTRDLRLGKPTLYQLSYFRVLTGDSFPVNGMQI